VTHFEIGDGRPSPMYHTDRRHLCTAQWTQGTTSRGSVSGNGDLCIQQLIACFADGDENFADYRYYSLED